MTQERELSPVEQRILSLFERGTDRGKGDEHAEREADNALALAQKLAAKHSIDLELLRRKDAKAGKAAEPVEKIFYLPYGPYTRHRADLASQIGLAMGLRTRIASDGGFVRLIGFPEDVEMAWQIFGLVVPQMLGRAQRRIDRGEHREIPDYAARSGHVSAKSFKSNYFQAFTRRVAARIMMSREEAAEEVVLAEGLAQADGTVTGRVTGALVLVDRKKAVELAYRERYPEVRVNPATGRKVKDKTWRTPTAARQLVDAQMAGASDGNRARVQLGGEIPRDQRSVR